MSSDPSVSLMYVLKIFLVKIVYIIFPALRSVFRSLHHFARCLIPSWRCLVANSGFFMCVVYTSSAYCEIDLSLHFGLLTYILNKTGLIMLAWGTPLLLV